jgi:hypothetical protein
VTISAETALKKVNLCLTPNDFIDNGPGQQAGCGERRAVPMHPLKQGAAFIIDERNVVKIHQNFAAWMVDPGSVPARFKLGDPSFGKTAADFQRDAIADRIYLGSHHYASWQCTQQADY